MKKVLFVIIGVSLLSSCAPILGRLYGVHTLKTFNKKKHEQFVNSIKKGDIETSSFYANKPSYNKIRMLPQDTVLIKAFSQPIQMLYFNGKRQLVSVQANCYAKGGLTNLNWNTDNRFDQFIPKSAIDVKSTGLVLSDFSKCYSKSKITSNKKYTILIYWTLMFEKISRSAIETVINNIKSFNKANEVKIYLINNDKAFIQK